MGLEGFHANVSDCNVTLLLYDISNKYTSFIWSPRRIRASHERSRTRDNKYIHDISAQARRLQDNTEWSIHYQRVQDDLLTIVLTHTTSSGDYKPVWILKVTGMAARRWKTVRNQRCWIAQVWQATLPRDPALTVRWLSSARVSEHLPSPGPNVWPAESRMRSFLPSGS